MRHSYLKNAAVLTTSDILLRLAGMGFRIGLANSLGGVGMGLYQLVSVVYGLFITLAGAGITVAATRLMAQELACSAASARGMLRRLLAAALGLGVMAGTAQFALAGAAARWWLGEPQAAPALRVAAFSLPFMVCAGVLRGFFIARGRVWPNACSQLAEQAVRIGTVFALLARVQTAVPAAQCTLVLLGTAASEAVSAVLMALFYRMEARRCFAGAAPCAPRQAFARIWQIFWPVQSSRVVAGAMHAAENILIPACLAAATAGGRSAAVASFGSLKGMALPLLQFPFGLLGSLAVLCMPALARAQAAGRQQQLHALLGRMLALTLYFGCFAGAVFWAWGGALGRLLYQSAETGWYLHILGPAMPFLYLAAMLDGALKGIGGQKALLRLTVWDAVLRIAGILALLPRFGMQGLLFVMICSYIYSCLAGLRLLLRTAGLRTQPLRLAAAPAAAAGLAAWVGRWLHAWLQPAGHGPAGQLACCVCGVCGMGAAYLALALPLGLWRQLQAQQAAKAGFARQNPPQKQ